MFPGAKLAVFVDGCFWHGCPQHHSVSKTNAEYWAEKVAANEARDRETDRLLEAAGWNIVRIWEHVPPREAADLIEKCVRDLR